MCLWAVACAPKDDDERELRRALRYFVPLLWDETLEAPVTEALRRARARGLEGADAALADVDARGSQSPVVIEFVLHLARQQIEESERALRAILN